MPTRGIPVSLGRGGCQELVIETESELKLKLQHEIQAHVVHLMADNINRTNIGNDPIAIKLLETINKVNKHNLLHVADECLLIHSFPLKSHKWPTEHYYKDMGIIAYGLLGHGMEKSFDEASKILHNIFSKKYENNILKNFETAYVITKSLKF